MYSKELDVYIKEKDEFNLITSDGVTYNKTEAILLARESPGDLRAIHNTKRLFDGEYCEPPRNREAWNKESAAVAALWKSRLYGPPERRKRHKRHQDKPSDHSVTQCRLDM